MMLCKIAFRNILRNARRSLMTLSAVAVGTMAIVLFGEFMAFLVTGFQTSTVERTGHLSVFRQGFFEFGAGNPAAYGIGDYRSVIRLIQDDPALKPLLAVVTPTVTLFGIAGNFDIDASKTFFGLGVIPSDRDRMLGWDEYGIVGNRPHPNSGLRDDDETRGIVGIGLAQNSRLVPKPEDRQLPDRRRKSPRMPPRRRRPRIWPNWRSVIAMPAWPRTTARRASTCWRRRRAARRT